MEQERPIGRLEILRRQEIEDVAARREVAGILRAQKELGLGLAGSIPVVRDATERIRDRLEADAAANAGSAPETNGNGRIEKAFGSTHATRHTYKIKVA